MDYFLQHLEFIVEKALEEMAPTFQEVAEKMPEENRMYLSGFRYVFLQKMHIPYMQAYLQRDDVQLAYKDLTLKEQRQDIIRVLAEYKERRMQYYHQQKENERKKRAN